VATQWIVVLLLTLLAATAIVIVRMRSLFAAVMLTGIYSFLGAGWMLILDAPDVAFTEAAVSAGIATILMLATLSLTTWQAKPPVHRPFLPLAIVLGTGAALVYGTLDMPYYGDVTAPAHLYPEPSYVERVHAGDEIHMPNVVTAVLASYRGYDTLGETVVIFTAGIGVMLLLQGSRRRKPRRAAADPGDEDDP
jgi:multicomponent Na+:H+ antiporter subunit B